MAYLKTHEEIETKGDISNLILGVILRQLEPYKKEDVIEKIKFYLQGAKIIVTSEYIRHQVDEDLEVLYNAGRIKYKPDYVIVPQVEDLKKLLKEKNKKEDVKLPVISW